MQEEVGLQVVTDGEFRRGSYWGRFVERTHGFEIKPATFKFRNDQGHEVDFTAPYANAKIKRAQPLALDEYEFLHGVTKVTGKITLPAPSTMHFYRCADYADKPSMPMSQHSSVIWPASSNRRSPAWPRPVAATSSLMRWRSPAVRPGIREQIGRSAASRITGRSLYRQHQPGGRRRPDDVVFGVHMCRGNFKGHYLGAGGYESVAERFFANTNVNHFLLEYDTERAGDFAPLRFVPKTKGVVLGLVSTRSE